MDNKTKKANYLKNKNNIRIAQINNINIDKRGTKDSNNSNQLRNISNRKNKNENIQRRNANTLDKKNKYNNILNENDSQNKNNLTSKEYASLFKIIKELTYGQKKINEKLENFIDKQEKINEILLKKMEKHDKLLDKYLVGNNNKFNTSISFINANKKQIKDK